MFCDLPRTPRAVLAHGAEGSTREQRGSLVSRSACGVSRPAHGARHMEQVEILLWRVPPAVVTAVAMLWVSWLGRARPTGPDRSDAAQERFAAAILRDLPSAVTRQVSAPRPCASGAPGSPYAPRSSAPRAPSSRGRATTVARPDQRAWAHVGRLSPGERVTP